MTNKEAIEYLKEIKSFDVEIPNDYQKEALDIAINILSKSKKGHWIDGMYEKCSVCNMEFLDDILNLSIDMGYPNFCPNCGADMKGEI